MQTDANDVRNLFMLEKSTSVVRLFQIFITRFPKYDATVQFPFTLYNLCHRTCQLLPFDVTAL